MVLVYDDDILCIHKDTLVVIDYLTSFYIMKQGIMGPPYHYLGSNIEKVQTQEGKDLWATHRGDYCEAVIVNMEKTLTYDGKILSHYGDSRRPYPSSFNPEIDTSADMDVNGVHDYQQHIGVLCWVIELGRIDSRIDIMNDVSCF